jgi:hypothetical protein
MKNQLIATLILLASAQAMAGHKCKMDLKQDHNVILEFLTAVEIDSEAPSLKMIDTEGKSEILPAQRTVMAGGSIYLYEDDKQAVSVSVPEALGPRVKSYNAKLTVDLKAGGDVGVLTATLTCKK